MCCEQDKMGARQQNNTIYAVHVLDLNMRCVIQDMGAMDWCRSRYFKAHNTNGFAFIYNWEEDCCTIRSCLVYKTLLKCIVGL